MVNETMENSLCVTTGMSCTTCATGTSTTCVRQQVNLDETLRHDRGVDDLVEVPQMRNVTWKNLYDLHTRDIDHLVQELQLGNLYGQQDRGDEPLRHDKDDDDHLAI